MSATKGKGPPIKSLARRTRGSRRRSGWSNVMDINGNQDHRGLMEKQ